MTENIGNYHQIVIQKHQSEALLGQIHYYDNMETPY
jgi:hypothetical protein